MKHNNIPYIHRMTAPAHLEDFEIEKVKLLVEWEKAKLRQIPQKHPHLKKWKLRCNPDSRAIEIYL